jgi:hypothetical protein
MIRHPPPQPTHPHLLGGDSSTPPFSPFPSNPHTIAIRDRTSRDFRPHEPSYMAPIPQQYAHPLPRSHSYGSASSSKDDVYSNLKQSEHMLRRKTPNGILNAAYDGTSVEQAERPHAMKHILLPVSHQLANTPSAFVRDLPLRTHSHSWAPSSSHSHPQPGLMNENWMPDNQAGLAHQNTAWNMAQPQLPQIDSMLNQLPTHGPVQFPNAGVSPYGFMPPPLGPSFGPTASNDSGPYGPYWPNGMFEPYRPAALRDMRYYSHHMPDFTGYPVQSGVNMQLANWQLQNQNNAAFMGALNSVKPYQGGLSSLEPHVQHSLGRLSIPPAASYGGHHVNDGPLTPTGNVASYAGNLAMLPPPSQGSSYSFGGSESGQTTPTAQPKKRSDSITSEFGIDSPNGQLREKIFTWAHSVYVDLLKYLHELRKRTHGRGGHHPNRGSMYPKPPRQPGYDFSNSSSSHHGVERKSSTHGHSSDSASQHSHHHSSRHSHSHRGTPHGQTNYSWPSQIHHPPKLDRHHSWSQPSLDNSPFPPSSQGQDRLRTLRRTSGPSFSLTHLPVRHEGSPTSNATAALGALTELCQDSTWQWVDGMLLGGCLAYALADYQKAMDWYTKILSIDSK